MRAAAASAPTIEHQLAKADGRPSGFDYLRLILALGIIVWHSFLVSYGFEEYSLERQILAPFANLIVPMFFALSGFLVTGSLERSRTVTTFLGLRALRILPALSAEAVLSAFVIGPLFTTLALWDYFGQGEVYRYLLNITGAIHYTLPGVFTGHPVAQVNGQLWTVPYEELCYLVLAAMAVAGMVRRRAWLLGFAAAYMVAQVANGLLRPSTGYAGAGGSTIVMAFMAGVLLFRYRDRVPWSWPLFVVSAALSLLLPMLWLKGMRFAPVPIAYATIWLGLLNPRRSRVALGGDYSYGLYVFGFPVQQAVWAAGPFFRAWYTNLLLSIPVALGLAVLSWWLIEKPMLRRRAWLHRLERAWLARREQRRLRLAT